MELPDDRTAVGECERHRLASGGARLLPDDEAERRRHLVEHHVDRQAALVARLSDSVANVLFVQPAVEHADLHESPEGVLSRRGERFRVPLVVAHRVERCESGAGELSEPREHLVRWHRSQRFDPLLVERPDVVAHVLIDVAVDLDGRPCLAGEHRLGADDVRHVVLHAPARQRRRQRPLLVGEFPEQFAKTRPHLAERCDGPVLRDARCHGGSLAKMRAVGCSGEWSEHVVERRLRTDGPDRLEVVEMRLDHVHRVDVIEQLHAVRLGLADQVRREGILGEHDRFGDRLRPIDDAVGLQPLGVQPAHVEQQQLLDLLRRESSLALRWKTVAHEVDRLVELVHRTRGNGVETMGFAAHDGSSDRKHEQRRHHCEHDRDAIHGLKPTLHHKSCTPTTTFWRVHDSSYEKMDAFVRIHLDASRGRPLEILDFGSQTVDEQPKSYRGLFDDPAWTYRGLDIEAGANVDVVVADPYDWAEIASDSVDLVISGQAFEHVEYYWASMFEIVRVLRPGGLAVIIAPSTGFEHRYPVDCWRFYRDGFVALAAYVDCEVVDAFTDWDREVWGDSILVTRKPHRDADQRSRFAVRSSMQRALLNQDLTELPSTPTVDTEEPVPTRLGDVTPGALAAELQVIREAHLERDAEVQAELAAAAEAELAETAAEIARGLTGPPSTFDVTYGKVRAQIAALVGERGRTTYKKLRGRA